MTKKEKEELHLASLDFDAAIDAFADSMRSAYLPYISTHRGLFTPRMEERYREYKRAAEHLLAIQIKYDLIRGY